MTTSSIVIPRHPQACWLAFTAIETLCAWVPGLRAARLIARAPNAMPAEIEFEFAESRRYTLSYSYEGTETAKIVRWYPRSNHSEAVRGWARFEPCEGGTRVEYELFHGPARNDLERYLDDPEDVLAAFARWMTESRPT
jgi:hypothetical protein